MTTKASGLLLKAQHLQRALVTTLDGLASAAGAVRLYGAFQRLCIWSYNLDRRWRTGVWKCLDCTRADRPDAPTTM